jgi:hypothetical protein
VEVDADVEEAADGRRDGVLQRFQAKSERLQSHCNSASRSRSATAATARKDEATRAASDLLLECCMRDRLQLIAPREQQICAIPNLHGAACQARSANTQRRAK